MNPWVSTFSSSNMTIDAEKEGLKKDIESGQADIFQLIPRNKEYDYTPVKKAEKILAVLREQSVTYDEILKKLVCNSG